MTSRRRGGEKAGVYMDGYVIRATVKADIDTGDVEKFMEKDAEEISRIVANEKFIRIASRDAGGKRIHCPKNYPRG